MEPWISNPVEQIGFARPTRIHTYEVCFCSPTVNAPQEAVLCEWVFQRLALQLQGRFAKGW
jgi:hypothetical protein